MRHTPIPPPPEYVIAAFAGSGPPQLLTGGENRSYGCGHLGLKAQDDDEATEGLLDFESSITDTLEFRFPRPLLSKSGMWAYEGWCGTTSLWVSSLIG